MAALIPVAASLLFYALAVEIGASAHAMPLSPEVERWRPYIVEASRRFDVPEAWIAAVMQAESRGQTLLHGRPITSRAGAMGLMQLMPGTWEDMRRRHDLGADPHDPHDNILAGAAYLREMHDRFGYPGLFAAYNAGPARYAEHLRTGKSLPAETRGYIAQLARAPATPSMPPAVLSGMHLFFALGNTEKPIPPASEPSSANPLFAPLGQARKDDP